MALSPTISVDLNPAPEDTAAIASGLLAYNVAQLGEPQREDVTVFARDEKGTIVGGLQGTIRWRWLYVARLWVSSEYRGRGTGTKVMLAAEEHARSRGCTDVSLDTFEFQAREFYEKLGYRLFGILEGYPPGYRQYYLTKSLTPAKER